MLNACIDRAMGGNNKKVCINMHQPIGTRIGGGINHVMGGNMVRAV